MGTWIVFPEGSHNIQPKFANGQGRDGVTANEAGRQTQRTVPEEAWPLRLSNRYKVLAPTLDERVTAGWMSNCPKHHGTGSILSKEVKRNAVVIEDSTVRETALCHRQT